MLGSKRLLYRLGRKADRRGAYSLVRVLRAAFCFEITRLFGQIFLAVAPCNILISRCARLFRNAQRIGTHIGYKTRCARSRNVNALVKLLRNAHCALTRKAQFARSLLLKRGGYKGGSRLLFAGALFKRRNYIFGAAKLRYYFVSFFRVRNHVYFLTVGKAIEGCLKAFCAGKQLCVYAPIFFGIKLLNFPFALYNQP